ncbi:MAG: sce7726 family protein [Bifidobacterium sp.]|jgi:hypothetical protein|nr:sce7726 family protein [Bifidobacterium sp.]
MMNADDLSAAALAMLSTPVLRSAMTRQQRSSAASQAVLRLVDLGLARGITTIRSLIWRCDRWLEKNHRSDVVYRKAVVTQMLDAVGGTLLPEFRANRSFADFLSVSQQLHAVEIKSDLDNTSRLATQLADYQKIAPFVSVIGSQCLINRLTSDSCIGSVGLHWLDESGVVHTLRPAEPDTSNLDSSVMMRSLRRSEYLAALAELGIFLPSLPNTRVFSSAMDATRNIDPALYYEAFSAQLRQRRPRAGRSAIARLPAPVRPAVWRLNPTTRQLSLLHRWLDQEVTYVHA